MRLSKNWGERQIEAARFKEILADSTRFGISGWLTRGIDIERMKKIKEEKENDPRPPRSNFKREVRLGGKAGFKCLNQSGDPAEKRSEISRQEKGGEERTPARSVDRQRIARVGRRGRPSHPLHEMRIPDGNLGRRNQDVAEGITK
jgi:general stress protein YciG